MQCSYCSRQITISRKGLCGACYARQVRNGTPETVQVNRRLGITSCSFCGSDKAPFVKSLCKTCWQRNRVNGTPEPKVSKSFCTAAKCTDLAVARGFCELHYRRWMKLGSLDTKRPEGWGAKTKHPLYHSWRWMVRQGAGNGGIDERWQEFWCFVDDVGEKGERCFLRRIDETKPYGPTNFRWEEGLLDTPTSRANKADHATYMRAYYAKRPETIRRSHLKRYYGLTPEDEARMLSDQNGMCAICKGPEVMTNAKTGQVLALAVDHCHATNKNRGLLCRSCNTGLGLFADDPDRLRAAADYLERHQSPRLVPGMTLVATLPEELGAVTGLRIEGDAVVASSKAGIDFVIAANKLDPSPDRW